MCRANALLLLDGDNSTRFVAKVLFLDPDTVRSRYRDFEDRGPGSMELADYPKREGHLSAGQEMELKARFSAHPPRGTNELRDWVQKAGGCP